MSKDYKSATFRIKEQREPRRIGVCGEPIMTTFYTVQRMFSILWLFPLFWRTEKYWRHKNDSPGSYVPYKFDTVAQALDYINRTDYTTKVLWGIV